MKKGGGSESTIIIGPSMSVLVYGLHSPISGARAKIIIIARRGPLQAFKDKKAIYRMSSQR